MQTLLHSIAFTHHRLDVSDIGHLHLGDENKAVLLKDLKEALGWTELYYLSTCNRVEFFFCGESETPAKTILKVLNHLYPQMNEELLSKIIEGADYKLGDEAINHLFEVACSIDSMVVGEREIITQVRQAFDDCQSMGLTGDYMRLLIKKTIEVAKKVYTHTNIAKNPVSVVSLAYHRMRDLSVPLDARVVIIGAGITNTTLSRFLKKHGYSDFTVFNRTLSKAENLAEELGGRAFPLSEIKNFDRGFDVLIACTGIDDHIVSPEIYESLLKGEQDKKVVIDIAIPQDLHPEIVKAHSVHHISVSMLQKISDRNLEARSAEISKAVGHIDIALAEFHEMVKERQVELAMRDVPKQIKDIKSTAVNEVFKQEMEGLDEKSKEVLDSILGYMEKKYVSLPMKLAKEILLKKT